MSAHRGGAGALRQRLLMLTLGAILPLAIASAFALFTMLMKQRDDISQSTLALTRAIANAVDKELRLTIVALQALALVPQVRNVDASSKDLRGAYELAKAVRGSN